MSIPTNSERRYRAACALEEHADKCGNDPEETHALSDLLADLMHLSPDTFEMCLRTARMNYEAEREDGHED